MRRPWAPSPEIFDRVEFGFDLNIKQRLLFFGIFFTSDRNGERDAIPVSILEDIFPLYDCSLQELEADLKTIERVGGIILFEREGIPFLKLSDWPELWGGKERIVRCAHGTRRYVREKVQGTGWSPQEWENLKAKHQNRCLCCGKAEPEIRLVADHVIPLSEGGAHNISNIQPLCRDCNNRKYIKTVDFRKEHGNGARQDAQ